MRFLLLLLLTACAQAPAELEALVIPEGANPQAWQGEIEALVAKRADLDRPVVFLGSSSIRLWSSLETDMAPLPVINYGFGGSKIFDSVYWLETLLEGIEPRALVVFSGTNDIAGDHPREPQWIAEQFDALVTRFRALGHDAPLYYIAISPTPSRERHLERVLDTNRLIAERCAQDRRLHFIDTASALLDSAGRPDPKWFVSDRLHLNADGYASWTARIRPALEGSLAD